MKKLMFVMLAGLLMTACWDPDPGSDSGLFEEDPDLYSLVFDSAKRVALAAKDSNGVLLYDSAALYEAYFPFRGTDDVDSFDMRFMMYKNDSLKSYALVSGVGRMNVTAEYSECDTNSLSDGPLPDDYLPFDSVYDKLPDSLYGSAMDAALILKDGKPEWRFIRNDSVIYTVR